MLTSPTILVPGITGTKLVNSNTLDYDTIWSGVQSKFETLNDLALQDDATFEVPPRSIIRPSDLEDLAYREIVSVIERKCGSLPYIFGYDWRQSSAVNGRRLHEFVNYLRRKLNVHRFNFVTHSLGGHVFACFLRELGRDLKIVGRAVVTAPPFLGSVRALISLVIGEGGIKFPLFNSNDEFRKIARTFPSIYELLPRYEGGITCASGAPFNLYDYREWQENVVDTEVVRRRISALQACHEGMFHLNDLPVGVRSRIVVVAAEGEETQLKVVVQPTNHSGTVKNFFDFEQGTTTAGDGTVPLISAGIYCEAVQTIVVRSKWYDGVTHAFILNDGRVQTIVKRWLLGEATQAEWWSDIAGSVRLLK